MRCPTYQELPTPPAGKTGWPWIEVNRISPTMSLPGEKCPCISIVAPSFNQAGTIEETLRSVLLQGYPDIELIVIDGGSQDESIQIIRKYEPWISFWSSEPDLGQSDAINKGFFHSHGQIQAWINTDDIYYPQAFSRVAERFMRSPTTDIVYGNGSIIDENSQVIDEIRTVPFSPQAFLHGTVHLAVQSAVFWQRNIYEKAGRVDIRLRYAMDVDLYLRFLEAGAKFEFIHACLGAYRQYPASKTIAYSERSIEEAAHIPSLSKVRSNPGYKIRRQYYRLRQFLYLVLQGDFSYLLKKTSRRSFSPKQT